MSTVKTIVIVGATEVFERNRVGRAFYSKVGFELVERKVHEPTGFKVLRLRRAAG